MAKSDFLDNVRLARRLYAPPSVQIVGEVGDASRASELAKAVRSSAIWLTPKSVDGFQEGAFSELGADRSKDLADAVAAFLAVAHQVPPDRPPTDGQYTEAGAALERVFDILKPCLPTREEAIGVDAALRRVEFPNPVVNYSYDLGSDSDGQPAIWVTAYLNDAALAGQRLGRLILDIGDRVRSALAEHAIQRWPYVRLRTVAEHKGL